MRKRVFVCVLSCMILCWTMFVTVNAEDGSIPAPQSDDALISRLDVFSGNGDDYQVKAEVLSVTGSLFLVAGYNDDGKMTGIVSADLAADANVQEKDLSVTAPEATSFFGYLLSKDGQMTPQCDCVKARIVNMSPSTVTLLGKEYSLGMSTEELTANAGVPDEILNGVESMDWYIYGTDTYENFFMAGVSGGEVRELYSTGIGFEYMGLHMGDDSENVEKYGYFNDAAGNSCYKSLHIDTNDNNIIHAVHIAKTGGITYNNSSQALAAEAKMDFHMVNAFRVYHGVSKIEFSEQAANSARLHSEDMADKNYFDHKALDGRTPGDRLHEQGVTWWSYGENIAAGYYTAIDVHDGWINSSGHRDNMLTESHQYLGTGGGYSASSTYRYYYTEDFYS